MTESKSEVNLWLGGTDCFFNFFKGDCMITSIKKGQRKKIFGLVIQLRSFLNEFDVLLNSTSRSFNMEVVFSIAKNGIY